MYMSFVVRLWCVCFSEFVFIRILLRLAICVGVERAGMQIITIFFFLFCFSCYYCCSRWRTKERRKDRGRIRIFTGSAVFRRCGKVFDLHSALSHTSITEKHAVIRYNHFSCVYPWPEWKRMRRVCVCVCGCGHIEFECVFNFIPITVRVRAFPYRTHYTYTHCLR